MDAEMNAEIAIPENWSYTSSGHRLLKGHFNQNDCKNENQCVAMSAVAIVALFVFGNPFNWSQNFVDQILYEGDRYYGEIIESIGQKSGHFLAFEELLEQVEIFEHNITLEINPIYRTGTVTESVAGSPTLLEALFDFEDSPFVGVIIVDGRLIRDGEEYVQIGGYARAVLKWGEGNQRRYYLFDSHDEILLTGKPMERLQEAAIVATDSIVELYRMLCDRIKETYEQTEQVNYNMATVSVIVQPQTRDQPQAQSANGQPAAETNPTMVLLFDNTNFPPVLSYYDAQKKETKHWLLVAQKSEENEITWTDWENVEITSEARNIVKQIEFLSANEQQQPDQLIDDSAQQPSSISTSRTIPHLNGRVTRSQTREQSTNADEGATERPRDENQQE